ncbi:MAG: hypothetical protein H0U71_06930 [Gammaproteobacteria bacterium]|nr:hypothetical protein [Gammaproteobacteria bacterium]
MRIRSNEMRREQIETQLRQLQMEAEHIYTLPNATIEQIQQTSQQQFALLVLKFGALNTPTIIYKVLSQQGLTVGEVEATAQLNKMIFIPNGTVFESRWNYKNNHASALVILTLLTQLQCHYSHILSSSPQEAKKIEWIPKWSKDQAKNIEEKLIYKNAPKPSYRSAQNILILLVCLYYVLYEESNFSLLKKLTFYFGALAAISALSEKYIIHPLDKYLTFRTEKEKYGAAHVRITDLIKQVMNYNENSTAIEDPSYSPVNVV